VGHRVDDVGRRQLGGRRLGEVDGLDAGQRALAPLGRRVAQLGAALLLGQPLELPVVVQEPHEVAIYPFLGSRLDPRPPMNSSQNVKMTTPIAAVVAKIGPMIPLRWSWPAARRTRIHRWSRRLSTMSAKTSV